MAKKFASLKLVEVKYVIDVDNRYLDNAVGKVEEIQGKKPLAIKDYRKALDDKDVDAIATYLSTLEEQMGCAIYGKWFSSW